MQTNMDKSPIPSLEKENDEASIVGTQWLVGGLITLIPICIVIYFIFFWTPDRESSQAPTDDEVVAIDATDTQITGPATSIIPRFDDSPFVKDVPQEKIDAYAERQAAGKTGISSSDLPALDQSDTPVLEDLASLSPLLEWYIWLYSDEVVRKFVTVIDNIANGKITAKHISIPRPSKTFKSLDRNETRYLDPGSYDRYRVYADVFDSLNNNDLMQVYQRYSPLMEEAYRELGYPKDRTFHKTLLKAINNLLRTPVIHDEIAIAPLTPVLYQFADPNLEALPATQKQLIRMGPRNSTVILRKLKQLKGLL